MNIAAPGGAVVVELQSFVDFPHKVLINHLLCRTIAQATVSVVMEAKRFWKNGQLTEMLQVVV